MAEEVEGDRYATSRSRIVGELINYYGCAVRAVCQLITGP